MQLSPEEWQQYDPIGALRQRNAAERSSLDRRKEKAWQVARTAANLLREKFGAQKVVLFGSLADSTHFTRWSDIDLAVWGIAPERFYEAVADITGMSTDFKIDLVDADNCAAGLQENINQEGVSL